MSSRKVDLVEVSKDWIVRQYSKIIAHLREFEITQEKIMHSVTLFLLLAISFVVRLFPFLLGWDPLLKAFDPWVQLSLARFILDEGGLYQGLLWRDEFAWYPYGREVGSSMYLAVPIAINLIYIVVNLLGFNITLTTAATLVPVVFGTLGVYYTYKLGTEIINKRAGLFAAILMSVTPAYMSRSIAGFTDNEAIGVLLTVMSFYYFSKAINKNRLRDAIFAGIALALLASSWGAFRYGYDLIGLYVLVLIITGNYSTRLLKQYSVVLGVSIPLMSIIPRISGTFVLGTDGLGPIVILVIAILYGMVTNIAKKMNPQQFRRLAVNSFLIIFMILSLLAIYLISTNLIVSISDKFVSVLLPGVRAALPLIDSVAEHQPLTWGTLYYNLNIMTFLIPVGVFVCLKKPTEKNLLILTIGLTCIYFSGSLVRLLLLLAPAAVILSALAIDSILTPYALIGHKRINIKKTTIRANRIGNVELFLPYFLVIIGLMTATFNGVHVARTYAPNELTSPGGVPTSAYTDWFQAFDWMKEHTSYTNWSKTADRVGLSSGSPPVMLSWWDYGYYITLLGETISLVDNATINSTQIGTVGTMLMWNASAAIKLMYKYNVKHILINTQAGILGRGSDIAKSIWMIKISEQYTPQYKIIEEDYFDQAKGGYHGKYLDSVLFRLSAYRAPDMTTQGAPLAGASEWGNTIAQNLQNQEITTLQYFREVFRSTGMASSTAVPGDFPFVRIFEVVYPDDIKLQIQEFDRLLEAEN